MLSSAIGPGRSSTAIRSSDDRATPSALGAVGWWVATQPDARRAHAITAMLFMNGPYSRFGVFKGSPERASMTTDRDGSRDWVVVRGSASGFAQEISVGPHRLHADEPIPSGGTDTGPSPYDLLLAALGSCTSMTVSLYARRRKWPLQAVVVRLRHSRSYPEDCVDCEAKSVRIERIECEIGLTGELSDEQRAALLAIAEKCPVHRTLTSGVRIDSRLSER